MPLAHTIPLETPPLGYHLDRRLRALHQWWYGGAPDLCTMQMWIAGQFRAVAHVQVWPAIMQHSSEAWDRYPNVIPYAFVRRCWQREMTVWSCRCCRELHATTMAQYHAFVFRGGCDPEERTARAVINEVIAEELAWRSRTKS